MRKNLFSLSVIAILQTVLPIANAGTTTGTLASTLTILSGCYINDGTGSGSLSNLGTINFGSVVVLSSVINVAFSGTQSGSLNLYCSTNTAYTIAIDNGLYSSTSGQRRLRGGASAPTPFEYVNYNLFKDSNYSQPWSATPMTGVQSGTGTGIATPIPLTIYAQVPIQTTPSVSTYIDTVIVTVTW
ncbi:Csu type fimbrial protein [Yersinia similis]|uniref:Csu type fimbrial protein n=1 Tax=Yersinia similis TaxID=367190 RepID=UPI00119EB6A9|nr:spore coat U domain-containing protein [Yersinia similis]